MFDDIIKPKDLTDKTTLILIEQDIMTILKHFAYEIKDDITRLNIHSTLYEYLRQNSKVGVFRLISAANKKHLIFEVDFIGLKSTMKFLV